LADILRSQFRIAPQNPETPFEEIKASEKENK